MNASEGPRDADNSANDNNQHHEPLHEVSAYAVCNGIGQKESGDAGGKADQGVMYDLRRVQAALYCRMQVKNSRMEKKTLRVPSICLGSQLAYTA